MQEYKIVFKLLYESLDSLELKEKRKGGAPNLFFPSYTIKEKNQGEVVACST